MPPYAVEILPSALARIPNPHRARIARHIEKLAAEPRPSGAKKLTNDSEQRWRIRVGDYRVLYRIEDFRLLITVVKMGHRRDIYR